MARFDMKFDMNHSLSMLAIAPNVNDNHLAPLACQCLLLVNLWLFFKESPITGVEFRRVDAKSFASSVVNVEHSYFISPLAIPRLNPMVITRCNLPKQRLQYHRKLEKTKTLR